MQADILSVLACVLVSNFAFTSALNSYSCTKTNFIEVNHIDGDAGCDASPIKPDPIACMFTPPNDTYCTSIIGKSKLGQEIISVVSRHCTFAPAAAETKLGCFNEYPGFTDVQYCICKSDNCNGQGHSNDDSGDEDDDGDNPANQVIVAHFMLPVLGAALRQIFRLL